MYSGHSSPFLEMSLSPVSSIISGETANTSSWASSSPKDFQHGEEAVLDLSKNKNPYGRLTPPATPPFTSHSVLAHLNPPYSCPFKELGSLHFDYSSEPDRGFKVGTKVGHKIEEEIHPEGSSGRRSPQKSPCQSPTSKDPKKPTKCVRDATYWERRRRNNQAAKKSRDLRRTKHKKIAIRVSFLERRNLELKCKAEELNKENILLRNMMLYSNIPLPPPAHATYPTNVFISYPPNV